MLRILIPILILLILIPVAGGYFYFSYFTSLPEVLVPDLKGMPLPLAIEKLESLQLSGVCAGSLFDMELAEGTVVSQRPEAGRKVKTGRVVNLLTSSGKRKVVVPNLLGRTETQAGAVLTAKGLMLGAVNKDFVPELERGIILSQNPLPEEEVPVGSSIDITVSSTEEAPREGPGQSFDGAQDKGGWFWPWP